MTYRIANRKAVASVVAVLIGLLGWYLMAPSFGAQLGERSMQLSSSEVSVASTYRLSFAYATPGPVGAIDIQFCSNDPLPQDPCTAPAGFDASGATLSSQTGETGFAISGATPSNEILLSRAPSVVTPIDSTYVFDNVINPSSPGSYFVRVQTYTSSDTSGTGSDYGGIAFAINNALSITATVPPFLTFCTAVTIQNLNCATANGDYIDFGELSFGQASSGTSKMLATTNAANGYGVTVQGTTLTSGNNIIAALASNDVSRPGTAQFGFNLRANSSPGTGSDPAGPGLAMPQPAYNQPDFYRFASGDTIIANAGPDDVRLYTATYIANVPKTQAAGVYVSTLTYICLANF